TNDDVRGTSILGHVHRVFVAHVDDGCADLNRLRARADGGEERERRAELACEVVHAERAIFGEDLIDCCPSTDGVVFTEDIFKIANEQGRYAAHWFSSGDLRFDLLDRLDVSFDVHAVADHHSSGLEHLVPCEPEVLAIDQ